MSEATSSRPAPGRHQRSARNYLLDRRFQLKYAGFLMAIALVLSVVLGFVLWWTSGSAIAQSRQSVKEAQEAVRQGQETVRLEEALIVESGKVRAGIEMMMATCYKDNPELKEQLALDSAPGEKKLQQEQERLKREAADLVAHEREFAAQAAALESQQRNVLLALLLGLPLFVLLLGAAGIMFTHKVAGPIFKMKRLLREVGSGKLVIRESLRKGDELHHFFEAFELMVADLRGKQEKEIARLDEIILRLEGSPRSARGLTEIDADGMEMLKRLRRQMQDELGG